MRGTEREGGDKKRVKTQNYENGTEGRVRNG